ncbi:MAG: hypothetical protein ABIP88_17155, partial [Candidatus Binatia bacterium]
VEAPSTRDGAGCSPRRPYEQNLGRDSSADCSEHEKKAQTIQKILAVEMHFRWLKADKWITGVAEL